MRLGIAAVLLLPVMALRGGMPSLRAHPRQLLVLGVPYAALPFMLLAYASLHITAGMVAVLNATAPLFAALIAHYLPKERMGTSRAWACSSALPGWRC